MTLLKIAKMGDPILSTVADVVDDPTSNPIKKLLDDMHETMVDSDGTGLAAPQVHSGKRVIIFMAQNSNQKNDKNVDTDFAPLTALINPSWKPISEEIEVGWEGCLSIPGLTGAVPRYTNIKYQGYLADGTTLERQATGFHARVFQHEYDHLDGVLYPQRMENLKHLVFTEEVIRHGLPS